jgi:knotted carbamoyltransferase YgeW
VTLEETRAALDELKALDPGIYDKDFLLTWQYPEKTIRFVLLAAQILEAFVRANIATRLFDAGLGLSIIRHKSTRTRYANPAGCNQLGQMTEGLTSPRRSCPWRRCARLTMIGFTEAIGIRDDMFLGEGHKYMMQVSAALCESHQAGVLPQRPAVINLQCDLDHPTQSLADLCHLVSTFGRLDRLKGKKLAMTWAYSPSYGKPLSVPQGVVALMTRFGMDVVLARPEGYDLVEEPLDQARRFAAVSGGSLRIVGSMEEAFDGADVVYPKSWAPAHVMRERTRLLRSGEPARLAALESEALATNARFKDWECNDALMARTKGGGALYMHCLPADVTDVSCAGGEVSRSVFERARLDTYRQAGHKPFIIAAMILATRLREPSSALERCLEAARPRRPA